MLHYIFFFFQENTFNDHRKQMLFSPWCRMELMNFWSSCDLEIYNVSYFWKSQELTISQLIKLMLFHYILLILSYCYLSHFIIIQFCIYLLNWKTQCWRGKKRDIHPAVDSSNICNRWRKDQAGVRSQGFQWGLQSW